VTLLLGAVEPFVDLVPPDAPDLLVEVCEDVPEGLPPSLVIVLEVDS
jgi:hypothetical protein